MVVSLNHNQQGRVYNYFQIKLLEITSPQMDEATWRMKIDEQHDILQQRVNEEDLQGLHLQDAMIAYLLIRVLEEKLHLSQTPVPAVLLPYFQNIDHSELRKEVNRYAVFPTRAVQVNQAQPVSVSPPPGPLAPVPASLPSGPLDTASRQVSRPVPASLPPGPLDTASRQVIRKDFIRRFKEGSISYEEAMQQFERWYYEDMGYL